VVLDDQDIIELMRILTEDNAKAAAVFLKKRFYGRAPGFLEGG